MCPKMCRLIPNRKGDVYLVCRLVYLRNLELIIILCLVVMLRYTFNDVLYLCMSFMYFQYFKTYLVSTVLVQNGMLNDFNFLTVYNPP